MFLNSKTQQLQVILDSWRRNPQTGKSQHYIVIPSFLKSYVFQMFPVQPKAWFSYVGKIPDDRRFYCFPTIPDFADISDIRQRSVPDFNDYELFICDRGTGAQQFRGLVMSEIHRRRMPMSRTYKFEFSFVGNDRRPSQKSGTRRENRNAPDSPDLSPFILDDRGYL